MTQVAVCLDSNYDATTGTCAQTSFVDSSLLGSSLPPLSGDDGATIGLAILSAWIAGAAWRWIGRALDAY